MFSRTKFFSKYRKEIILGPFFKLLEASDKDNIIKTLLIRYSLQPHVSEYLINRKFSSLLGKIGDLKKEKDNVEEEINDILSKLNDIDKYLISQIKEKVKKYIKQKN